MKQIILISAVTWLACMDSSAGELPLAPAIRERIAQSAADAIQRFQADYMAIPEEQRDAIRQRLVSSMKDESVLGADFLSLDHNVRLLPVAITHFLENYYDNRFEGDAYSLGGILTVRCTEFSYADVFYVLLEKCIGPPEPAQAIAVYGLIRMADHDDEFLWGKRSFISAEHRWLAFHVLEAMIEQGTFPQEMRRLSGAVFVPDLKDPQFTTADNRYVSHIPEEIARNAEEAEVFISDLIDAMPVEERKNYEELVDQLRQFRRGCVFERLKEADERAAPIFLHALLNRHPSERYPEAPPMQEVLSHLTVLLSTDELRCHLKALMMRECFNTSTYISSGAVQLLIGMVVHFHWKEWNSLSIVEEPQTEMSEEEYHEITAFFERTLRLLADVDDYAGILLRSEIVAALRFWRKYGYRPPNDLHDVFRTTLQYLPREELRWKDGVEQKMFFGEDPLFHGWDLFE